MNNETISFIGAGNMSTSLISGLVQSGFSPKNIWVSDRNPDKLQRLVALGLHTSHSNTEVAKQADVLVLAVKPQDMEALIKEIREPILERKPLIVSLASGIHTEHLDRFAGSHLAIVRAMPNTPALLRVGATGLYANAKVTEEQKSLAESLMRAVGITIWVDHERDIDLVAALSGSGPAYFFLIMEALQEGAEALGLSSEKAKLLTLQTALGAARMALESDISLSELRQKVASKGGTTERALSVLETGGIRLLLRKALEAARDRAVELSHNFDK